MTPKDKAKSIIHSASAAAGSVALSPIPFTDAALLVPIQVGMITSLFKAYDQKMMQGAIRGAVWAVAATSFGRGVVGNAFKFVPGLGAVAGATISATTAVGLTEVIGWAIVNELETGNKVQPGDIFGIIMNAVKKR
ncbi:DUF697 domain-containing protein [Weissella cibaria]|uniref:DUF697 domain-containing protein n=1 Tax=Weissella cibaria TaxID=137591 RepID=UPI00106E4BDE|nr:DUF697 domain-containing protein [Weissella cibaria]MBZ5941733.1 DUF697 domain-containing protein [Weissella cibaria]MCB5827269.1 DUF697 domain-containing protein [Weissella cibaria]MCB5858850.1 DUF697 domain-containing protein [Weissella cibaria]MCB5861059.1 DUF697 domain-containing protein [Weissella cibaria]MCB5863386.1 DUF697 domain-containing protein [Weissella cibaria]